MNINYEDIITKANNRKDRLQQLVVLLESADCMTCNLLAVSDWLRNIENVYTNLDEEGRAMLPAKVKNTLEYISQTRTYLGRVFSDNNGHNGIELLIDRGEQ